MADLVMSAGTELSNLVPEIWSRNFYETLLTSTPFRSLIDNSYESEISALGNTVNISQFPEFGSASVVNETARVDANSITVSQIQLVINKRIANDFIITNRAMLQSLPVMDKLQQLAIYSIQKKIQSEIIDAISPSASSPDHVISYDSGTTLALADLLEIKELLDDADVPMSDRSFVIGSEQMNDLFNITGFVSSDFVTSGAPLQTGQLPPALLGFQPNFTTAVGDTGYFFHKSFMTIAAQKGITVSQYDLGVDGKRAARLNVDTLLGIKQMDDERVVSIS